MSDKAQFLKGMFPNIDLDVIKAILTQHNDDVDAASSDLLQLGENDADRMVAVPKPPPAKHTPPPSHRPPAPQQPKNPVGIPPFGGGNHHLHAGRGGARMLTKQAREQKETAAVNQDYDDDFVGGDLEEAKHDDDDDVGLISAARATVDK